MYRLEWLSDELRHHLRSGGEGAQRMADTISHLPGETALVEFDFDSLAFGGEGVALLASLAGECRQRGVEPISMGGAAGRFSDRASEHSPPTMTAMPGISVEDVGGVGWVESLIFGRMQQAYDMGRLVDIPAVRRLADRLLQRANLALPGLAAQANARPSSYTSMQWWALDPGYDATAEQVLALYDNFIQTMGRYAAQEAAT